MMILSSVLSRSPDDKLMEIEVSWSDDYILGLVGSGGDWTKFGNISNYFTDLEVKFYGSDGTVILLLALLREGYFW